MNISNLTQEEKLRLLQELQYETLTEEQKRRLAYEDMRDEIVQKYLEKFKSMQNRLVALKGEMKEEVDTFISLLYEYGKAKDGQQSFRIIDKHGNVLEVSSQKLSKYDERAELAAMKVKEFVKAHFRDQTDADFILSLLDKNEKGKFSEANIQRLYKYEDKYQDQNWKEAIKLFKESFTQFGTKEYMRIHEAQEDGGTRNIYLDFSKL